MFWIASSCPTIMRRKLPSRASASRPVRVGSKGTLTRNIFFWAPFTTTPYFPIANWMPYRGTTVKALLSWLCWSALNLAYQSPFRHSQQHEYNLPNIFWRYLPIGLCRSATTTSSTKLCIDASRHYVRHPDVVVSMVQHHRFGEPAQPEFGSVVCRAARKRILARQAADVDDVGAATFLHSQQGFARAVKHSRQIGLNRLPPILRREFRRAFHYSHARIIHENIRTAHLTIDPLKQRCHVCACSYIGSFSCHFTLLLVGEPSYSFIHALLAATTYRHHGASIGQRTRGRKTNPTCCSRHYGSSSLQKSFVHGSILRSSGRYVPERTTRKRVRNSGKLGHA